MEIISQLNKNLDNLIILFQTNKPYIAGVVIPIFNRPEYVNKCFSTLKKSNLNGLAIILVDDNSNNITKDIIKNFSHPNIVHKIFKPSNKGMHDSFIKGFDYLLNNHNTIEYLITLDSDTIHKPNWFQEMLHIYKKYSINNNIIVTGFNTVPSHKILETNEDHHIKKSCGGVSMMFNKGMYNEFIKNSFLRTKNGWDWDVMKHCETKNIPIICTKPSVIQHIGVRGIHSSYDGKYDIAIDF